MYIFGNYYLNNELCSKIEVSTNVSSLFQIRVQQIYRN